MRSAILLILALSGCDKGPSGLPAWLKVEARTIIRAAARNGVTNDADLRLLFAIRRAELGGPGREFGIMNSKAHNLDLQAAWCACTIRNHRLRHADHNCGLDFIACLGRRYAPIGAANDPDGLNKNWESNVRHFYEKEN